MAVMESLRRLDERVFPITAGNRARTGRILPWMALALLITQAFDVFSGPPEFLEGVVFVWLGGFAVMSLQISRWLREQ